jgi:hypothetical protein
MRGNRRISAGSGTETGLTQWLLSRFDKNKNGKIDPEERQEATETFRGRDEKPGGS